MSYDNTIIFKYDDVNGMRMWHAKAIETLSKRYKEIIGFRNLPTDERSSPICC